MGIEPTGHDSRRSPTGFEDQARHQTRSASERTFYHRFPPGLPCCYYSLVPDLFAFNGERSLGSLCDQAAALRSRAKGPTITFSPKVFIPLTRLCRDACGYCVFRQEPKSDDDSFMSPEEVLAVAQSGQHKGCREALFVLGERPETRYPEAQRWLKSHGYDSSVEYLYRMCQLVLQETTLYPHTNAGTLTRSELAALKQVNASLGLMLESTSLRLLRPEGPHASAASKHPRARLKTLATAGELGIPFTTGILVGIGESRAERLESLRSIHDLQLRYGHIQEVIIQNFRAKPGTPMATSAEPTPSDMLDAIALARLVLGPQMNIQAPPNLSASGRHYLDFLGAGLNDWGGISPVTIDFVNPEAPWPHLQELADLTKRRGFQLRARFPVYPEYIRGKARLLPKTLRARLTKEADSEGYIPPEFGPVFSAPSERRAQSQIN